MGQRKSWRTSKNAARKMTLQLIKRMKETDRMSKETVSALNIQIEKSFRLLSFF